ncbi:MAG TPA: hypothetical protein VMG41_16285 [Gemmatimonadales bacterium]|nr:hypothetical protein [Gemmatimonadales bacterium]
MIPARPPATGSGLEQGAGPRPRWLVRGATVAWAVASLAASGGPLLAQERVIVSGRVARLVGADTVPVARARVVLHHVAREEQGPIDSMAADGAGRFLFRFRLDTAAVYLLSSNYDGIEYFSSPLHAFPAHPDTGLTVVVSDTSAAAPVMVASRHIVIGKPAKDGTRPVLEIVVLENQGQKTRVSGDTARPTWGTRLPQHLLNFQVGEGDASPEAMEVRNDSVLLFAPVAPGEKQLLYTYELPRGPGTVRMPVGDSIGVVNVLLEEFDRHVTGGAIARADTQRIEGRSFMQWAGPVASGSVITIDFPRAGLNWPLIVPVTLVGLGLLTALLLGLRRPVQLQQRPASDPVLDELARLDAQFAGREAEVGPEAWARYQQERSRLKEALAQQLAGKPPTS